MPERIVYKTCRCGREILIMPTKRGKKIGVNREPVGHDAYRFRRVGRLETLYVHGDHQPHFLTCTNPDPKYEKRPRRRR